MSGQIEGTKFRMLHIYLLPFPDYETIVAFRTITREATWDSQTKPDHRALLSLQKPMPPVTSQRTRTDRSEKAGVYHSRMNY